MNNLVDSLGNPCDVILKSPKGKIEVFIDWQDKRGYWDYEGESIGGLWFDENKMLCDYDGVSQLPKTLKEMLKPYIYPDELENY